MEVSVYFIWFVVLAVACAAVYWRSWASTGVPPSPEFKGFQRMFMVVYLTMMMADWMQGPYVYALYDHYGFSKGEIGQLFIVGFGSSMIFGTIVGGFADKYGRKLNCLLFCVLYGVSCVTKHFNNFAILMVGRLLGGVATSILFSAFETWMIHEHRAHNFSEEWMNGTFSGMTFGSGLVAILSGLIASALASAFGFVAPFDASLLLLVGGGVLILVFWKENYGDASRQTGIPTGFDNFSKAWRILVTNEKVLLLGLVQSCFEAAMYIFVFMWTPALESSLVATLLSAEGSSAGSATLPHGVVFAMFMVCMMLGSKLFETLIAGRSVEHFLRWVFVASAAALSVPILTQNHYAQLVAFLAFEICCGIYFPSAGTMRSRYIPEEVRSTIMNVFRIGLNLIVVVALVNIDHLSQDTVFLFTVMLLTLAVLCQHRLFGLAEQNLPVEDRAKSGLDPGDEMDTILATKTDASA